MRRKLRSTDQLRWLESHNAVSYPVYKQRAADAEKMQSLLHGLKYAEDPREELNTNILFASSNPYEVDQSNSDGLWSCNSSLNSYSRLFAEPKHRSPGEVNKQDLAHGHNLQQVMGVITGDMNERQKAGMNPSTLLTEHRRKVLFDALLGTNEVKNEPRELKKTKMSLYLNDKHPKLMTYSNTLLLSPPNTAQDSVGRRLDRELATRSRTESLSQQDNNSQGTDDSSYNPAKYAAMIGQNVKHHHVHGHAHGHTRGAHAHAGSTTSSLSQPGGSLSLGLGAHTQSHAQSQQRASTAAAGTRGLRESTLTTTMPGSGGLDSSGGLGKSTKEVPSTGHLDPQKGKFKARWENYDIMKHRWSYIRPQTHDLCDDADVVVPTGFTSSAVVSVDNSNMYSPSNVGGVRPSTQQASVGATGPAAVLHGRVLDFKQYAKVTARNAIKNQRLLDCSGDLRSREDMRASQELNRPYQLLHQKEISVSRSDIRSAQASCRTMTELKYTDYHPSRSLESLPASINQSAYIATNGASMATTIVAPVLKAPKLTAPKGSKVDTMQSKYAPQSSLSLSRSSGTVSVATYTRESNFPTRIAVPVPDQATLRAMQRQQEEQQRQLQQQQQAQQRKKKGRDEPPLLRRDRRDDR
jgi:hypothetical protein